MRHIGFRRKRSPGEGTNEGKAKDVLWECQKQLSHAKNHGRCVASGTSQMTFYQIDFLVCFFPVVQVQYSIHYGALTLVLVKCCSLDPNL